MLDFASIEKSYLAHKFTDAYGCVSSILRRTKKSILTRLTQHASCSRLTCGIMMRQWRLISSNTPTHRPHSQSAPQRPPLILLPRKPRILASSIHCNSPRITGTCNMALQHQRTSNHHPALQLQPTASRRKLRTSRLPTFPFRLCPCQQPTGSRAI